MADVTLTVGAWVIRKGDKAKVEFVEGTTATGFVDGKPRTWAVAGGACTSHGRKQDIVGLWVKPAKAKIEKWIWLWSDGTDETTSEETGPPGDEDKAPQPGQLIRCIGAVKIWTVKEGEFQ